MYSVFPSIPLFHKGLTHPPPLLPPNLIEWSWVSSANAKFDSWTYCNLFNIKKVLQKFPCDTADNVHDNLVIDTKCNVKIDIN